MEKLIKVKLMGGLGNQMFQYAFGKSLSISLKRKLVLDVSFFATHKKNPSVTQREYNLHIFNIPEMPVLYKEQRRLFSKILLQRKTKIVLTDESEINYAACEAYHIIELDGYFQSEKYFTQHISEIRNLFVPKFALNETSERVATVIKSCNAVSIHIRRGDYINNPNAKAFHGVCNLQYYHEAIKVIESEVSNTVYFIFSDDIEWCKKKFVIKNVYFIEHNTINSSHEDMILMSLCKHNIIANSSFSWWGAWLNSHPRKIVISPQQWFTDNARTPVDLIPREWIKI